MKHILTSDQLQVSINDSGAEMTSVKNRNGLEFIWQADPKIWPRHAPILFPVVGKLKNNSFVFNDHAFEMSQHGFARDSTFTVIESQTNSCTLELRSDEKSKSVFPFEFVLRVKYELAGNVLSTYYSVHNPSQDNLFFSIGAHPGFHCPLTSDEIFEDYYLEFESSDLLLTELNNGLRKENKQTLVLKDKKLALSKTLFEKDALVFENNQINKIHLCSRKSSHKISLECAQWPYFGIWSKKECDQFVCLEPWYGIADKETTSGKFPEKDGIICVESGKSFDCSFSITFD